MHARRQMFCRSAPDLPLALPRYIVVGLGMIAHHLLQELADLLGSMLGVEFDDLLWRQPRFQGHLIVAACGRKEEKERLAVAVSKRKIAPAELWYLITLNLGLPTAILGGGDEGAEEEGG